MLAPLSIMWKWLNRHSDLVRFFAQYHAQHPQAGITVSRLSYLECLVKPLRENNAALIAKYQDFFQRNDLEMIDLTAAVIETATNIRARHNLATPDAIQAASCLHSSASLFVTNDPLLSVCRNLMFIFFKKAQVD